MLHQELLLWQQDILQKNLIEDELGTLSKKFNHVKPIFIEKVFRNIEDASIIMPTYLELPTTNPESDYIN